MNREARFNAGNTLVIAGLGVQRGARCCVPPSRMPEGLIDGVVTSEPSAQPSASSGFAVQVGGVAVPVIGKPLIDVFTVANIYHLRGAGTAAVMAETSVYNYMTLTADECAAANRCAALAAKGW